VLLSSALYFVCWIVLARFNRSVIAAPAVPTGIHRNFYLFQGHVHYLDDQQAAIARLHFDRFLAFGWCMALAGLLGLLILEKRGERLK
jgi:hypothetical protein